MKCLICGELHVTCLCNKCIDEQNLEELSYKIARYRVGSGENSLWEEIANELIEPRDFSDAFIHVTENLPSPRREYVRMISFSLKTSNGIGVSKVNYQWLIENAESCLCSETLSDFEKSRIRGLTLNALYCSYDWQQADKIATYLLDENDLPFETYLSLIEFLTRTRRYDLSADVIQKAKCKYFTDDDRTRLEYYENENNMRKDGRKKGYEPGPKDAKISYLEFLTSLGINVKINTTGGRIKDDKIDNSDYPRFDKWIPNAGFKSFVAYDLETTGTHKEYDCVIEIGAIKVIDGTIVETKEFIFDEMIYPYGGTTKVKPEVTELTGITTEMAKQGRSIKEVWKEFVDFIEDYPLIGFNTKKFDSHMLRRAGRYGKIAISPMQYDVMPLAIELSEAIGIIPNKNKTVKLDEVAKALSITNPNAHRAYADALTTAKIYLELLNYIKNDSSSDDEGSLLDDMLDLI